MKYSDVPVFPSRKDVVTLATQEFREENAEFIMGILDLYGTNANEPHREFVQIALMLYATGDTEKLLSLVERAKCDYRECLHDEAFSRINLDLENQGGWHFFPSGPPLPQDKPVNNSFAAHLLKVDWMQVDEWVKNGELKPISKARRPYLFAIEELERFQRKQEPEFDMTEVWRTAQQGE